MFNWLGICAVCQTTTSASISFPESSLSSPITTESEFAKESLRLALNVKTNSSYSFSTNCSAAARRSGRYSPYHEDLLKKEGIHIYLLHLLSVSATNISPYPREEIYSYGIILYIYIYIYYIIYVTGGRNRPRRLSVQVVVGTIGPDQSSRIESNSNRSQSKQSYLFD
jgi:hypothetical protein